MPTPEHLRAALTAERRRLGLTQQQLAEGRPMVDADAARAAGWVPLAEARKAAPYPPRGHVPAEVDERARRLADEILGRPATLTTRTLFIDATWQAALAAAEADR